MLLAAGKGVRAEQQPQPAEAGFKGAEGLPAQVSSSPPGGALPPATRR